MTTCRRPASSRICRSTRPIAWLSDTLQRSCPNWATGASTVDMCVRIWYASLRAVKNQTSHQLNCLYRDERIDSSTYPSDVYAFLDAAPQNDGYEDGDVNEWLSFFGPLSGILDPVFPQEETPPIPESVHYADLNSIMKTVLRDESGKHVPCTEDALEMINTCLEVVVESILNDCETESINRTHCEDSSRRVLVPALLNSVNKQNPYLQFVSNTGLQKPEHVVYLVSFKPNEVAVLPCRRKLKIPALPPSLPTHNSLPKRQPDGQTI